MIFEIFKSIIFGIVEGITEWLPVSSTGHMILLQQFLPLTVGDDPEAFYSMFQVVIQLGAIMAVVVLYFKKLWPFGKKHNKHPYAKKGPLSWCNKNIFVLWFHILISCIPAAIVGIAFDDELEALFYNYQTVAIMLILVGIAFIVVEIIFKNRPAKITRIKEITYKHAFLIGMFQLIAAIFPGTSRSGATIIGALLLGVSRAAAAEYTFYLAVPVMFGASLLKIVKFGFSFTTIEIVTLLVGMVVAFVVSWFCIKFLLGYIRKHDFKAFGIYRIIVGIVVLGLGLAGMITG